MLTLLALLACDRATDLDTGPPPPDLTERLGAGEVRAGIIVDEASLFAGIAAEGRPGDVLVYNDRVRFVIQGIREGQGYVRQSGHVLDADLVRPEDQPGRDAVEDWLPMYGLGRTMQAERVEVRSDGADGVAVVEVEGHESVIDLVNGALESDLFPDLGVRLKTEYRLEPDSYLLEVRTTATATADDVIIVPSDILIAGIEVVDLWDPGFGIEAYPSASRPWTGLIGKKNDIAYGLMYQEPIGGGTGDILGRLVGMAQAYAAAVSIPSGQSHTWTRWYGVGPDLAALETEQLARLGQAAESLSGTVTAPDGPVAGARVLISVDDQPWNLAVTGADGSFSASVPAGFKTDVRALGRAHGFHTDLGDQTDTYSNIALPTVQAQALGAFTAGAPPVPLADGRGAGTAEAPLLLAQPATLSVRLADGKPFALKARRLDPRPEEPAGAVPAYPDGEDLVAWAKDGALSIPALPGRYRVLVHRGIRWELHEEEVSLEAGVETLLSPTLAPAYAHDGWLLGDPHMHASPSPDGKCTMADRLVSSAGAGLQVHFGTDHDQIGDYRALRDALGLGPHLATVIATEVSPVQRGHLNLYPLQPDASLPNNGGWPWWLNRVPDTETQFALIRDWYQGEFVIQSNHPLSGLLSSAAWAPGRIRASDRWSDDFQAIEVLNGGDHEPFALYLDLVSRGLVVTPTGVSDAHRCTSGRPGLNATFFGFGVDDPAALTDDHVREAVAAQATIVTAGPFLHTSLRPGAVVRPGPLEVEIRQPSWMHADTLELWENDTLKQTVSGTTATFDLNPASDAAYVVVARGGRDLAPVWPGARPWAMTAAIRVDVTGDGWSAPLPALEITE